MFQFFFTLCSFFQSFKWFPQLWSFKVKNLLKHLILESKHTYSVIPNNQINNSIQYIYLRWFQLLFFVICTVALLVWRIRRHIIWVFWIRSLSHSLRRICGLQFTLDSVINTFFSLIKHVLVKQDIFLLFSEAWAARWLFGIVRSVIKVRFVSQISLTTKTIVLFGRSWWIVWYFRRLVNFTMHQR